MAKVAYASKEFAFKPSIPTYVGGLGVLAGDVLKADADLEKDVVGIGLNNICFTQCLDRNGWQREIYKDVNPNFEMRRVPGTVYVEIADRRIKVGAWEYDVIGQSRKRHIVPVFLLDTNVNGNSSEDRRIVFELYPSDSYQKLLQDVILSVGGLRMLRELGYDIENMTYHMNESPPGLITSELFKEYLKKYGNAEEARKKTMEQCVFTSHTSLPHGNEDFEFPLVRYVMNHNFPSDIERFAEFEGRFSLMVLASNLSGYRNAVSIKTADILNERFRRNGKGIFDSISNGVHSFTWTSPEFQELYDEKIPEWRNDNSELRNAQRLEKKDVWNAHQSAKKRMINYVYQRTGEKLDEGILTIGNARRETAYKRTDLILWDIERLLRIGKGKLQLVLGGKSHPNEEGGKRIIYNSVQSSKILRDRGIPTVFIEDYDMNAGAFLTAGVDLWLNTPRKPYESSGTSGMKAAHNGIPQFSTLDGWWIYGCKEGVTGWAIGDLRSGDNEDKDSLYKKLEEIIIPLYYKNPDGWLDVMIGPIFHNASYYNTQRVAKDYEKAYQKTREFVRI